MTAPNTSLKYIPNHMLCTIQRDPWDARHVSLALNSPDGAAGESPEMIVSGVGEPVQLCRTGFSFARLEEIIQAFEVSKRFQDPFLDPIIDLSSTLSLYRNLWPL